MRRNVYRNLRKMAGTTRPHSMSLHITGADFCSSAGATQPSKSLPDVSDVFAAASGMPRPRRTQRRKSLPRCASGCWGLHRRWHSSRRLRRRPPGAALPAA